MVKFRPGGFFDLLFNIELKKLGVKIFREISYFSSPYILAISYLLSLAYKSQIISNCFLIGRLFKTRDYLVHLVTRIFLRTCDYRMGGIFILFFFLRNVSKRYNALQFLGKLMALLVYFLNFYFLKY